MHAWWLVGLFLFASGCIAEVPVSTPRPHLEPGPLPAALPAPIRDNERVPLGANPVNDRLGGPCHLDERACFAYPFAINESQRRGGPIRLDAVVSWEFPPNDFDLYLLRSGDVVDSSTDGALSTTEALKTSLGAGEYELLIAAWAVALDAYSLEATFSHGAIRER